MRPDADLILMLWALVAFGGPFLMGLAGIFARPGAPPAAAPPSSPVWNWRLIALSTLLYVLAFNLVFFVQEVFLVWPKALTPGLSPVLYHNNHNWTGDNPVANLLQGTGALAILIAGLVAGLWVQRRRNRPGAVHLFGIWIAYSGLFQSLPQGVAGAIFPPNDVGRAMDYLGFGPIALMIAALASMAAMIAASIWLLRPMLSLADADTSARPDGRSLFILQAATIPAALGTLLILPFRVPGSLDQVVIVPVAVAVLGIFWMQAAAWRVRPAALSQPITRFAFAMPLAALVAVFALFHLVLRPGVAF